MRLSIMGAALLLIFVGTVPVQADVFSAGLNGSSSRILLADASLKKLVVSQSCSSVEMFVTSWCGYCKMMERVLDKKGIPYTTYDIEKDDTAARTYRKLGGRGVPLVRVGSKVVYGYDPDSVISYADCN
ncbi:MAG: glutaredoxin domain-containing protein [Geobacteraceae bacterium]|nr:glutaredoxin domain-containing protein [Geobacteraceae bacterium]